MCARFIACVSVAYALVPSVAPRRHATRTRVLESSSLEDELFAEMGGSALFPDDSGSYYEVGAPGGGAAAHDYTRVDDGSAAVDVAAVDGLLAERLDAKRDRNFVLADDLRDVLFRSHGVRVWDRERTWGVIAARSGQPRELPAAHDYDREGDLGAAVDVAAVDALLLERLHSKMRRDFDRADALRDELLRAHGVRIHDGKRKWRAGVPGGANDPWVRPADDYRRVKGNDDELRVDEADVVALVQRRSTARRRQNWALADDLLDELLMVGVDVDDKQKTWRAVKTAYDGPDSLPEADLDVDAVTRLIARRSRLKLRRKFDEADDIRNALMEEYNVHVDDKARAWSLKRARKPRQKQPDQESTTPVLEDLD